MKLFEYIINRNDLVFDVGSNIGNKSEIFLNLGAKVISFEPQENCFNYLLNRFSNNDSIFIERIALDKKVGDEIMYISDSNTLSSMSELFINETKKERFTNHNWMNKISIQVNTLDNMIIKYGEPNFIKIDVEGYELNVLKGLTKKIKLISIEFVPEICQQSIDCIEYIDYVNEGNTVFNYVSMENDYFKYNNWLTKKEIINYLKSITDFKHEFGDIYFKYTGN
jgi:FkbM family methyltransferase